MSENIDPLVLDLVEWVAREPRRYSDVMEAWRTSCPRLTVWEEATGRALVERRPIEGRGTLVVVTERGIDLLKARGRLA